MSNHSFTLFIIPDTKRIKAIQIHMSYSMLISIVLMISLFTFGIGYLLWDFYQAEQSPKLIKNNLRVRQQLKELHYDLTSLERRMNSLQEYASQQLIDIELNPPEDPALTSYQQHLARLWQQAEIFTPILLKKAESSNETIAKSASIPKKWPLEGYFTSGFGYRNSPMSGRWSFHNGIDIAAKHGTRIYAPHDAIVVVSEYRSGYGNLIELDHGYGIRTRYGHSSRLLVHVGENVKKGEAIALVGSTGNSTGPHLHYEIRIDGVPVDPNNYVTEQ